MRALSRNEAVIPKSLSLALVEFAAGVRTYPLRSAFERAAVLTLRERQLVPLIAAGLSNKQIADRLIISEQTVKNHVRSILHKLHVRNRSKIPPQVTHPNLYTNSKPEVAYLQLLKQLISLALCGFQGGRSTPHSTFLVPRLVLF